MKNKVYEEDLELRWGNAKALVDNLAYSNIIGKGPIELARDRLGYLVAQEEFRKIDLEMQNYVKGK